MKTANQLLTFVVSALLVASFVCAFLGADSDEGPITMPLMNASMVCLVAAVVILFIKLGWQKWNNL